MSDPIQNDSLAIKTQEALVAYLSSRQCFTGVPVLGRRKGIIANDIDAAISDLGGACIYVLPGKPVKLNANLPGPFAQDYELRVRCIENPALNATLPTAYELYEFALRECDQIGLQIDALTSALRPAENNGDEPPDPERVIIDAVFYCSLGLQPRQGS